MRKLDCMLMGILLPVSEGSSAQIKKVSPSCGDPVLNANTFHSNLFLSVTRGMTSCVPGMPSYDYFNSLPTTTHDKIPNLSVRMCDSMLTVKDGPGVYRGQFLAPFTILFK
jgi:hypothetical protein